VSFTAGERPRYGEIRRLLVGARLLIENSTDEPEVSDMEGFIAPRQRLLDSGDLADFEEIEISVSTEVFGRVAPRFGTYPKRGRARTAWGSRPGES